MKKLLTLALAALLIFCITACEKDSSDDPAGTAAGQQQSPNGSSVAVYDMDMTLLETFNFSQPSDNTIDTSRFVKTGYRFDGIYDMNRDILLFNAKGIQAPTVLLDTNFTAVVKYAPITYQLVFDAGEGQLENPDDYVRKISYEEMVGLFPKPVLEGKQFDGWFDQNGNRFSDGTKPVQPQLTAEGYALPGEIIELQARYSDLYCNVRLIFQDGSKDITIQVKYGETLPDMTEYLKDTGSRVITGFGVSPSSPVPFQDAVYVDLDLYALWTDYKYINFVYSDTETKVVKVFCEGSVANLPDGVWPGYVFEGWYSSALLSGNKISTVAFNGMADTYYAKWSVGSYTIQFVADGKLISTGTFSIDHTDIAVPQVPHKQNYIGAWEDYTLEFKDMVINAVYTPEEKQVTLINGADYTYHSIRYGEMYNLMVPTKVGHEFTGWYYKGEKLTDEKGNSLAPYTFDNAITMTAGWEAKICTLYFETNGGNALDAVSVKYGQPYGLTQVPERAGYHFAGWFDESMTTEYIGAVTLTADTVIYAKWVKSTPVSTVDDLKKIADNPAGNYHLVADIDLKGGDWSPIENFSGILDGNGYKIHNFSLRQNGIDLGFVVTNGGTIKNITFSNVDVSSTLAGEANCSIGVVCAYNAGRIVNVTVEKVSILVNVSGKNNNHTVRVGGLAGESSGQITDCSVQAELMFKDDVRCHGYGDSVSAYMFVGGAVGKDSGTITRVNADIFVDANEFVYTDCYIGDCYESAYLNIGGISGGEYGTLTDCVVDITCQLYSNAGGDSESRRYTKIGGVAGACFETSTVAGCYAQGSISFKRVGHLCEYFMMATGGIVGEVGSGSINNCASAVNITLEEGHGGTTGGIVGLLAVNGKVSNVAYYGTIKTESFYGGYFGGLAGRVEGWLTKGYFRGKITSQSTQIADIAGMIESSGSVSKTIGNGKTGTVCANNKGSAIYNYLIGTDYGTDLLYSRPMLFDDLGLFEADFWSVDEEMGLHLISFPEK